MSLKHVHVVFIVVATLLVLFCGAVAFQEFRTDGAPLMACAAVGALLGAAALVRYEALFIRRCREVGIR
jgi:hypothetical protein